MRNKNLLYTHCFLLRRKNKRFFGFLQKNFKKHLQFGSVCDIIPLVLWRHSSVGQSATLTSQRSQIRVLLSPPKNPSPLGLDFLSNPKDWHVISVLCTLDVITPKVCMASREACISYFLRIDNIHSYGMITYAASPQLHTATSCGLHTTPHGVD